MKIAIIGAGISGLTAGRELSKAGHEVVIFEKSRGYGGRAATRYLKENENIRLDHGIPFVDGESAEFQEFIVELGDHDIVKPWMGKFGTYKDGKLSFTEEKGMRCVAQDGISQIGKYLARWVDVQTNELVGGLTFLGGGDSRKRDWMVNFQSGATTQADAIIIATPATQAYAILNTTVDEIETLKLIREIDEVRYESVFTLLTGYTNQEVPEWNALRLEEEPVEWIFNENSKRELDQLALVIHSSAEFALEYAKAEKEVVSEYMLNSISKVIGDWAKLPEWKQLHLWKYSRAKNPLPYPYMEINQDRDGHLALTGSYFQGNTIESAYLSGLKLGKYWAEKFSD